MCITSTPTTNESATDDSAKANAPLPVVSPENNNHGNPAWNMDQEQFMQGANLTLVWDEWKTKSYDDSEQDGKPHAAKTFFMLQNSDVLFGRGLGCAMRTANSLVRRALQQNRDFYHSLLQHEKRHAAVALVAYFHARGLRFVEPIAKGRGFVMALPKRVVGKIQQCLREGDGAATTTSSSPSAPDKDSPTKSSSPRKSKQQPIRHSNAFRAKQMTAQLQATKTTWKRRLINSIHVGDRLGIYSPLDRTYYPCTVVTVAGTRAHVDYDNGDAEDLDLAEHDFFLCKKQPHGKRLCKSDIALRIERSLAKASFSKARLMTQEPHKNVVVAAASTTVEQSHHHGVSCASERDARKKKIAPTPSGIANAV